MVLDPWSAFAAVCNVLQVIEVGVKVLSKAADYQHSETGLLAEHNDLRSILSSLSDLNTDLQVALSQGTESKQPNVSETRLLEANNQCLSISKDFVGFLDGLKLKKKHAVIDSLRVSIKAFWRKDKMLAMEKVLSQARDNLNISFLVYMQYVINLWISDTSVTC